MLTLLQFLLSFLSQVHVLCNLAQHTFWDESNINGYQHQTPFIKLNLKLTILSFFEFLTIRFHSSKFLKIL